MTERHLVVLLDRHTGAHRMGGYLKLPDEAEPRFTVPAHHIAGMVQHLQPKAHEAVLVLSIEGAKAPAPTAPRPTLRSV